LPHALTSGFACGLTVAIAFAVISLVVSLVITPNVRPSADRLVLAEPVVAPEPSPV
jgi:galactitol-specific phosphotransferase system IIC component